MLSRESWLPLALQLTMGQRRRVPHDCGDGRVMQVSLDPAGYRAWCFRCNDGGGAAPPQESLGDTLARLRKQRGAERAVTNSPALPEPQVRDVGAWPLMARVWLHKAGLGRAEIGRLGAYYHPPTDRVVLPVLGPSGPVFWQARGLGGQLPKYLSPACDRGMVLPAYGKAHAVTLTEDILSAFKVGMVGEGWAMLGTRVSDHVVSEVLRRGCPVNVWLDNDAGPINRGQVGAAKIVKKLTALGVPVRNIVSERDPKLMLLSQIKELLE